uniref:Uncharacterized protein n=1 Tax=Romanomermis culicivorax TaxID=13658 RepID=A0A915JDY8_ROMCU
MWVTGIIMAIEGNRARFAEVAAVVGGIASQVPPGRKIVWTQQGQGTVGLAMVLEVDSLDVGDFVGLFKWRVLRASPFVQKEWQMGSVDSVNYAELHGPEAGNPSQN